MAFWIVYQGNSWKRARAGGYLWAPMRGKTGGTQVYWSNMARVQPGDLIFAGVDNALRAFAETAVEAYTTQRPDPKDDQFWYGDGWRLDVRYTDLPRPLFYKDWVPDVLGELPPTHSPFHGLGKPNQGYLYELPNSVGEYVISLIAKQGTDVIETAAAVAPPLAGGETEKQILSSARIGQGKFRQDLLALWNFRCAISGVEHPRLLRASHIKPWSSSNNAERLDPRNGLLLSAAYDAAFDAMLISFADDGSIVLAADFPVTAAEHAGICENARIGELTAETRGYLAQHRALMSARVARDGG